MFLLLFGCGTIRPDRSDRTLKYEVRSVSQLATRVLPHFEQFPLLSSKRHDFRRFSEVVQLMRDGRHLTPEGFAKIVGHAIELNSSGKKRYGRREIDLQINA